MVWEGIRVQYRALKGTPRVGMMSAQLRLHGCGSLKEKRSRVRRLLKDLHDMKVSASEVGCLDEHDAAVIACVLVSNDWTRAERSLGSIEERLHSEHGMTVVDCWMERLV